MPVIIHGTKKQASDRTARGRAFDAAIRELAPTIAERQAGECPAIHELAEHLNELGLVAPSGSPFAYTTMRRVLFRLAQLGICLRPMTLSESRQRRERKIACHRAAVLAGIAQKYKK
jgi:hypothetical protein